MPSTKIRKYGPNSSLRLITQKTSFRLGMIAIDREHQFWALSSARYLWNVQSAQVVSGNSDPFGYYLSEDNNLFETNRIEGMIARIRVDPNFLANSQPILAKIWPRSTCDPEESLGQTIHSATGFQELGLITEADISVNINFASDEGPRVNVAGAYKATLVAQQMVKSGTGGTLYLNEEGDAVGLAVAYANQQVIVAPLKPYLEAYGLTPWSPLYSYWNNVAYRLPHLETVLSQGTQTFLAIRDISEASS